MKTYPFLKLINVSKSSGLLVAFPVGFIFHWLPTSLQAQKHSKHTTKCLRILRYLALPRTESKTFQSGLLWGLI